LTNQFQVNGDFQRVNNEKDLVPIGIIFQVLAVRKLFSDAISVVPGRFLGFSHPSGEVHIVSPGNAVSCPGMILAAYMSSKLIGLLDILIGDDDSTDDQCTVKTVPNILDGDVSNHLGPYEGISIGSQSCDP
jgi:hypothetical protein